MMEINRFILRKERFGGLLFDRKSLRLGLLDKKVFKNVKEKCEHTDVVMLDNPSNSILTAPTKIFLVLTRRCNIHCIHCSNNSGKNIKETLDYQKIEGLLKQFYKMGIFEIGLTGGEPLCHPDFFEIVELIKTFGLPIYLNTNGIYGQDILERLSHSKVEVIKISVDGLEKSNDKIRGVGTFRKAYKTIKYLKEIGNTVEINFTLNRQNITDIFDMIRLADEFGCDIKFAPMVKVGRAQRLKEPEFSAREGRVISEEIQNFSQRQGIRVSVHLYTELTTRNCLESLLRADFHHIKCGVRHMHMIINSNGDTHNTGCQTEICHQNLVGNVQTESVSRLWNKANQKNKEMRKEQESCLHCNVEHLLIDSFEKFNREDWSNL